MRLLFAPFSMPTHYFPVAPLVYACRAAGHDVRVVGQPPVIDAIIQSGMIAVPAGGGYDFKEGLTELMRRDLEVFGRPITSAMIAELPPDRRKEIRNRMRDGQIKVAEAMIDEIITFVNGWRPDLIVADPLMLAAPLAAAAAGVPLVHYMWAPDVMRQKVGFPGMGMGVAEWPDNLLALFARFGVEPQAEYAACTVDPCPASLQVSGVPNRVPYRYVPYNGAGIVPEWLSAPPEGGRRVCVTWGTTTTHRSGSEKFLVPQILKALSGFACEVVVAAKKADQELLGEVPPGVRVVDGLPLNVLLPTCDAIVHHAGGGTMLTSAYHGVPQITLAPASDQKFNAGLLASTGAGIALSADAPDIAEIEAAASRVLFDEGPRAAADRLRGEILAQPSPAEIVPVLQELA